MSRKHASGALMPLLSLHAPKVARKATAKKKLFLTGTLDSLFIFRQAVI